MDWYKEAKRVFSCEKPEHFTNYKHCDECFEHDETLLKSTIDTIGIAELGNPGWDPICFSSAEGIKYYMPALIRLSLSTIKTDFYLEQFLFHLESNGKDNDLIQACNDKQRTFVAKFIEYLIINHAIDLERNLCENEALRVHKIWENA